MAWCLIKHWVKFSHSLVVVTEGPTPTIQLFIGYDSEPVPPIYISYLYETYLPKIQLNTERIKG
jgi:hypothetical protein